MNLSRTPGRCLALALALPLYLCTRLCCGLFRGILGPRARATFPNCLHSFSIAGHSFGCPGTSGGVWHHPHHHHHHHHHHHPEVRACPGVCHGHWYLMAGIPGPPLPLLLTLLLFCASLGVDLLPPSPHLGPHPCLLPHHLSPPPVHLPHIHQPVFPRLSSLFPCPYPYLCSSPGCHPWSSVGHVGLCSRCPQQRWSAAAQCQWSPTMVAMAYRKQLGLPYKIWWTCFVNVLVQKKWFMIYSFNIKTFDIFWLGSLVEEPCGWSLTRGCPPQPWQKQDHWCPQVAQLMMLHLLWRGAVGWKLMPANHRNLVAVCNHCPGQMAENPLPVKASLVLTLRNTECGTQSNKQIAFDIDTPQIYQVFFTK